MIHVHHLDGCTAAPLAHYLKAFGILRLVAEQVDDDARGWWDADRFRLATRLSREELEAFFLYNYRPTPIVSPWNKGAGFFFERDPALSPIEDSETHRFEDFRSGINASRIQIKHLLSADKKVRDIKNEAKQRKRDESDTERGRQGFEEDYAVLIRDRDKAKGERDRILQSAGQGLGAAEKQLKAAQGLVKDADEYRDLLDKRDNAERVGARHLQTVFSQLKSSKNYKRRLNDADREFKRRKADLVLQCRLYWRGSYREWMDAAMVLEDDGTPKFPALLGTGGNDGNFDFTNNFMKLLREVFDIAVDQGEPQPAARAWISGAIWGLTVPGNLSGQPVGQFLPGTAGGANNSNGPDSDSMVNPIDFILMLEGAIAFTSGVSRRLESSESSRATSPFVVNSCAAAYASASADDENARGEQWMPLWSRPSTYVELRRLLSEGRAQVGAKTAREPLDFARAVGGFGVARGIKAFQRYGYIERNGQSNLAVPLGQFDVADGSSERLACIDDLDFWLRRLRRETRGRNASTRLAAVEKVLTESLFAVAGKSQDTKLWQRVLVQMAEVEETMARGSGFNAQPIPRLRAEWVTACYDGSAEFRLALAFALQARSFRREPVVPVDPIRRHWLPLDPKQRSRFATTGTPPATQIDVRPEVVMHGRRGIDDAVALVERRLVEASQFEGRHLPLTAAPSAAANALDLAALLSGSVDLDRTLVLARALMALDRKAWADRPVPLKLPTPEQWPDDAWLAIRLCTLPWPLKTLSGFELDIGTDPALIRRLAAGDAASAVSLALRRLGAAGVRGTIHVGIAPPDAARLWVAALAFPITQGTARWFLRRLDPNLEPDKE
ncbi:MAG: type I-U CRISPR-associated protein Csx17 [Gemmatimonadetes bacterium]|nr:type I-U CRISPR-associated protein Csx17 [Gemmatimonadota bacterium]